MEQQEVITRFMDAFEKGKYPYFKAKVSLTLNGKVLDLGVRDVSRPNELYNHLKKTPGVRAISIMIIR